MAYVPILKGKAGEFRALGHVSQEVQTQIRPVMEVVPDYELRNLLETFCRGSGSTSGHMATPRSASDSLTRATGPPSPPIRRGLDEVEKLVTGKPWPRPLDFQYGSAMSNPAQYTM